MLQIINNALETTNSFDWGYLGVGGFSSALTFALQKLFSWKFDKANLNKMQSEIYDKVMDNTQKVLDKALKQACFREPCKRRINAENE